MAVPLLASARAHFVYNTCKAYNSRTSGRCCSMYIWILLTSTSSIDLSRQIREKCARNYDSIYYDSIYRWKFERVYLSLNSEVWSCSLWFFAQPQPNMVTQRGVRQDWLSHCCPNLSGVGNLIPVLSCGGYYHGLGNAKWILIKAKHLVLSIPFVHKLYGTIQIKYPFVSIA